MSAETTIESRPTAPRAPSQHSARMTGPAIPVRGRRRPWLVALGALLSAVGALAVVWLVGAAGQRVEVLVVRAEVPYGQAISAADVGVARVSVDPGVAVVPSEDRAIVVGQYAATPLYPGMLLAPEMVTPDSGPTPGRAHVPVAIVAERMPAGGLRPGDRIVLVDAGDAAAPGSPSRTFAATVMRVGVTDVNGVTVVDVATSLGDAPGLSVASANGRVAVVVQASRS